MTPDLADLIKLLAHIAVKKYYNEVTRPADPLSGYIIDNKKKNNANLDMDDHG